MEVGTLLKNSLELHLQALCNENSEYVSLLSTWNLNKRTCVDALKTVVTSYPHFSMHDASHAEAVVTKIEMLLGDRVHKLSPTDTWLILHAAYAHDLGMVLKWEDLEKIWSDGKFRRFIKTIADSTDGQLSKAAKTVQSVLQQDSEGNKMSIDPLQMSKHVTLLNAAYFRKYHSEISRKYIDLWESGLKIDLGHSSLVQPRLIKLLGQICELHTADSAEVLKLDYQTDGVGADYAHPRFVAVLLRLGDLLDADNGRFSSAATLTFGTLPDSSLPHRDKHESTVHLLVTPTDIEFRSDCPNQDAYLETRNFISWLEAEIDFLKKYWDIIAPKNLGGYVPRFNKKELLINGIPDIKGVAGLKFKISQEKAFQIVEGSGIYGDPFICFREIIQNALDASKIQLWKDLVAGNYVAWMVGKTIGSNLQPFEIDKSIYRNYAINITLSTHSNGKTQVEITDRGTGISVDNFKRMCNVGESVSASDYYENFVETMPAWLRPTAGFGIGLQSIFLLSDKFEILTSTGNEAFQAVVHSNRAGGYLRLQKQENIPARGTTIKMQFEMPSQYSYAMFGETMKYLCEEYEPFSNETFTGEVRTIESLLRNCSETIFPLNISASIEAYKSHQIKGADIASEAVNWAGKCANFRYQLCDDCGSIKAWDTLHHVYGKVSLIKWNHSDVKLCFKGVQVTKGVPSLRSDGIAMVLDVYGLDTKQTLTLDRSGLTYFGTKQVQEIMDSFFELYITKVIEQLELGPKRIDEICNSDKFDPYVFWLACTPTQRKSIPNQFVERITQKADVLALNEDNQFVPKEKPAKDIIRKLTNETYFANIDGYDSHNKKRLDIYSSICSTLNQNLPENIKEVVVDHALLMASKRYFWNRLIKPEDHGILYLYSVCLEENGCSTEADLRAELLRGLGARLNKVSYNRDYSFSTTSRRYAIPVINDYGRIAVPYVPMGVSSPNFNTNMIISPFTIDYVTKVYENSKETFTKMVMEAETFKSLVAFVKQWGIMAVSVSEDDIINDYRRLIEEFYDAQISHQLANT